MARQGRKSRTVSWRNHQFRIEITCPLLVPTVPLGDPVLLSLALGAPNSLRHGDYVGLSVAFAESQLLSTYTYVLFSVGPSLHRWTWRLVG